MADTPQERLRQFIEDYYNNLTHFADTLGVTPSTLNTYLNTDRVYTNKSSLNRLSKTGINIEWYLHGVGEPAVLENLPVRGSGKKKDIFNNRVEDTHEKYKEEVYRIPKEFQGMLANIKLHIMSASAATGTLTDLNDLPTTYMPLALGMSIDEKSHDAIYVNGDSMQDAGVNSGDIIIFEVCTNKPNYDCTIVGALNGMPIVKHLVHQKNGSIILKSDSVGVKDIKLGDMEDFIIFGIVKKVIKDYAPAGKKN
jgi:SOS-response transcriptional repressor LexA